ncbi:hypothetical protein [Chryseobacterium indoltheticum]|uniref:hypothetical protein n=1 Tax=Chryseobacterium indoltheticum TaxID=254 RepID=UPI0028F08F75|nr:hypothetical protein [Chryseobacterium indoltheticum]
MNHYLSKISGNGFFAALVFLNQLDWTEYKRERMMVAMKEKKILNEEDTPTVG